MTREQSPVFGPKSYKRGQTIPTLGLETADGVTHAAENASRTEIQRQVSAQVTRAGTLSKRTSVERYNNGSTVTHSSPWTPYPKSPSEGEEVEFRLHGIFNITRKVLGIPFKPELASVQVYMRPAGADDYDYPILFSNSNNGTDAPQIVFDNSGEKEVYPGYNGSGIIVEPGSREWDEINSILAIFEKG